MFGELVFLLLFVVVVQVTGWFVSAMPLDRSLLCGKFSSVDQFLTSRLRTGTCCSLVDSESPLALVCWVAK